MEQEQGLALAVDFVVVIHAVGVHVPAADHDLSHVEALLTCASWALARSGPFASLALLRRRTSGDGIDTAPRSSSFPASKSGTDIERGRRRGRIGKPAV